MKPAPILLCLGALGGGSLLGWRHAPETFEGPTCTGFAIPKEAPTSTVPENPTVLKTLTIQDLAGYADWLEKAKPHEILADLAAQADTDTLRAAMAKSRFQKFPPAIRLKSLLDPLKDAAGQPYNGTETLVPSTIKDNILSDPDGCAKLLDATGSSLIGDPLTPMLQPLFERDGWAGTIAFIEKLSPNNRIGVKPKALALLAAKDLSAAQNEVMKTAEGKERNACAVDVAGQMMAADPVAAFEWLKRHSQNKGDSYTSDAASYPTGKFIQSLIQKYPEEGRKLLLENQDIFDGIYGSASLRTIFDAWGDKNFDEARAWLDANPLADRYQSEAISAIHNTKLRSLPAEEVTAFYQNLPPEYQAYCAGSMLEKLGLDGLPGGLEAFRAGLSGNARSMFDSSLSTRFQEAGPVDKKRMLLLLGPDKLMSEHFNQNEFSNLPEADQKEILSTLSDIKRKSWSLKQAKMAVNTGDFSTAMKLLQEEAGPNPKETLPHAQVAVGLLGENPSTATAWVESLPDGSAKSDAVFNLAANWGKTDLPAATTWVEALPPGDARDHAAESIVKLHGLLGDTDTALRLTQTIKDADRRLSALSAATRIDWFNNPVATEQRIAQQIQDPTQVQKVVEMIQKGNSLR